MTDFPAAHSMDTTWFAIDADGYVGIFDSYKGGALSENLTTVINNEIEYESDLLEILIKNSDPPIDLPPIDLDSYRLYRPPIDLEFILQNTTIEGLLSEIRDQSVYPYCRQRLPKNPIYFNDLPLEISQHIRLTRFPDLRFADTSSIQPIEHMPCNTWGTEEWLGTDGEWHERFPDYTDRTSPDLI